VGADRDIAGAVEGGLRRAWVSILVRYGYFQLRTAGNVSKKESGATAFATERKFKAEIGRSLCNFLD